MLGYKLSSTLLWYQGFQIEKKQQEEIVKWREDLAPSAEKNGELPLETFENQGALISELYSRVCCAPLTDFVDSHGTLINKDQCSNFVKLVAFKVLQKLDHDYDLVKQN